MGARLNRKHLSLYSVAPEFWERRLSDFLGWGEDFFSMNFISEMLGVALSPCPSHLGFSLQYYK